MNHIFNIFNMKKPRQRKESPEDPLQATGRILFRMKRGSSLHPEEDPLFGERNSALENPIQWRSHAQFPELIPLAFLEWRIPSCGTFETSAACAIVGFPSMPANSMGVLLYFWFHDYSKVEMWYNKKIGSLPERVSAPDRFVFFLDSTTMRSPFKKKKTLPSELHERARRTAENANQIF